VEFLGLECTGQVGIKLFDSRLWIQD